MLSNTSRYAIRALIYLAINSEKNKKIGIKKIAEDLDIPSPFLGKILQTLAKHKILLSTKGPNGGFGISNTALQTNLMDLIRIIDGDNLFNQCLITNKTCNGTDENPCSLHQHYESIRKEIIKMFSQYKIADLAEEFRTSEGKIEL